MRLEDATAAVNAGADAIGMVFDPASPRCVPLDQAHAIAGGGEPFVALVGLFVNADAERVRATLGRVPLTLLQFQGDETPEQCRWYSRPYIKAIHMRSGVDVRAQAQRYADAYGLLLDSYVPSQAGGSGQTFDWAHVPAHIGRPVILAGGLTPENVGAAIRQVRPSAVDVSTGVEVSKGVKDHKKIAAFIAAARAAL